MKPFNKVLNELDDGNVDSYLDLYGFILNHYELEDNEFNQKLFASAMDGEEIYYFILETFDLLHYQNYIE